MIDTTKWHWNITQEQADKINAYDTDTISQVYFDNLTKFKKIAYNYCRNCGKLSYFEDCVQQIFIDLSRFRFKDNGSMYFSLRTCFYNVIFGKTPRAISLDKSINDGEQGEDFYNFFGVDTFADIEQKEEQREIAINLIKSQKHLTQYQQDMLCCIAFSLEYYKGVFKDVCKECVIF